MFDELNFRNAQGDGKVAILACAGTVLLVGVSAVIGWPAVFGAAMLGTGYLLARART